MENKELDSILLKELDIYNPNAAYANFLNKKGITTVGQLLNACPGENFKSSVKYLSGKTRCQLRGFLSVIEHRYLGKPLIYDALLDEKIDFSVTGWGVLRIINPEDNDCYVSLDVLFGCPRDIVIPIWDEFKSMIEHLTMSSEFCLSQEDVKLIDFIKWTTLIIKNKNIVAYSNEYVNEYKKQQEMENNNSEVVITEVKKQLENLIEIRQQLDNQIMDLQEKINSLSNAENKGGIKR